MFDKLQALFEDDFSPVTESTVKVTVEIKDSELLSILGKKYNAELDRISNGRIAEVNAISDELFTNYINSLMWMRVNWVNGNLDAKYRKIYKYVSVPVLVYQLLLPIGHATDREFGIHFYPTISIEGESLLSVEQIMFISDILRRLENHGLAQTEGLPRAEEGELEYMAMVTIERNILSYKRSHPVYAFLSSFVQKTMLDERLNGVTRIFYGSETDFEFQIQRVLQSANGGQ